MYDCCINQLFKLFTCCLGTLGVSQSPLKKFKGHSCCVKKSYLCCSWLVYRPTTQPLRIMGCISLCFLSFSLSFLFFYPLFQKRLTAFRMGWRKSGVSKSLLGLLPLGCLFHNGHARRIYWTHARKIDCAGRSLTINAGRTIGCAVVDGEAGWWGDEGEVSSDGCLLSRSWCVLKHQAQMGMHS